jgi:hypothetical protein
VVPPTERLGIDGTRRGWPKWRWDEQPGSLVVVTDRWHVGFVDLTGGHGLLGQVEGRIKAAVTCWLNDRGTAWKNAVEVVAIDMCIVQPRDRRKTFHLAPDGALPPLQDLSQTRHREPCRPTRPRPAALSPVAAGLQAHPARTGGGRGGVPGDFAPG